MVDRAVRSLIMNAAYCILYASKGSSVSPFRSGGTYSCRRARALKARTA